MLACSGDRSNNSYERLHPRAHLQVKTMMALAMAKMPAEIATYEGVTLEKSRRHYVTNYFQVTPSGPSHYCNICFASTQVFEAPIK